MSAVDRCATRAMTVFNERFQGWPLLPLELTHDEERGFLAWTHFHIRHIKVFVADSRSALIKLLPTSGLNDKLVERSTLA